MDIDISNLPTAAVLAALYNASKVQGMGFLQARPGDMTERQAEELLKQQTYFDYLYGKVMKVDLSLRNGPFFNSYLYDRDNGQGAAQRVVNDLRASNRG